MKDSKIFVSVLSDLLSIRAGFRLEEGKSLTHPEPHPLIEEETAALRADGTAMTIQTRFYDMASPPRCIVSVADYPKNRFLCQFRMPTIEDSRSRLFQACFVSRLHHEVLRLAAERKPSTVEAFQGLFQGRGIMELPQNLSGAASELRRCRSLARLALREEPFVGAALAWAVPKIARSARLRRHIARDSAAAAELLRAVPTLRDRALILSAAGLRGRSGGSPLSEAFSR